MDPISHQTARLATGRHRAPAEGVCVMELASMLAGEPFSDRPASVSGVVATVLQGYNDGLDDDRRQQLKRYAAESIGTAAGWRAERDRRRLLNRSPVLSGRDGRSPSAWFARHLAAAEPYTPVRALGRRVAVTGDERSHVAMLALIDELIAVGRAPDALSAEAGALLAGGATRAERARG